MEETKNTTKNISAEEKARMVGHMSYYFFCENKSQKEVAELLNISTNTINRWVKELGWRDKMRNRSRAEFAKMIKLNDNLPAFISYLRLRHASLHETIVPAYKKFLKRTK